MSDDSNKPATDATPGQWVQKIALDQAQAEIERLRAEVAALVKPWADDVRLSARLAKERAEARAEVERLRGLLETERESHDATIRMVRATREVDRG